MTNVATLAAMKRLIELEELKAKAETETQPYSYVRMEVNKTTITIYGALTANQQRRLMDLLLEINKDLRA